MTVTAVELSEKATTAPAPSGTNGKFAVTIVKAGQGSSGYYSAEMLESDGPGVFIPGTKVFMNHPTEDDKWQRPERDVRDQVGYLSAESKWDAASQSVVGEMTIFPMYAEEVSQKMSHVGMSMRALGLQESRDVPGVGMVSDYVTKLVKAKSVDIVTEAGAGGAIVALLESARERAAHPAIPAGQPLKENKVELTKEALAEALAESNKTLVTALSEALKPAAPQGDPIDAVLGLATALSASGLNEAAQKLVIESVRHGAKPTEAIEAHKAALGVQHTAPTQQAVALDAYGQLVQESDRRMGLGYGETAHLTEANAGGNRAAIVGGGVVDQGSAAGAQALTEAERGDWEKTIASLVSGGRAF